MDEQNIPIDINNNKLLEWLLSRRHVTKDWQSKILQVREKINNAIQDMPAHDGIIQLLSGQHINYFHCLKIIEILKETEADTKNLFGRYGSQRMKDWQDIVSLYQRDSIYLAEAAQILLRNVSYEIPSLKKQVAKLEQSQTEAEKKIRDYRKTESIALKELAASCEQLGIAGQDIKKELLELVADLPQIYENATRKIKQIQPSIELYAGFNRFLTNNDSTDDLLPLLKFLIDSGNTTTYEYTYGEKPVQIVTEESPVASEPRNDDENNDAIDFGDAEPEIDFGDITVEDSDQGQIDWGRTPSTDEEFEIVEHVDVNFEESGIVVEKSGIDGGIAQGTEALTLLDNPKTRDQIINELMELDAFLKMRLFELSSNESDILAVSQMQNAPTTLQMATLESVTSLSDSVNVVISELTNKRIMHLHNIKHSPRYINLLAATLRQKLELGEKMRENVRVLEQRIQEYGNEIKTIQPVIKLLIEKTKQLQGEVEEDVSRRYKGRPVHIVGGVNML